MRQASDVIGYWVFVNHQQYTAGMSARSVHCRILGLF
jgi:hypothetical protein